MNTATRYAAYDEAGNIQQIISGIYHYKQCGDDVSDDTHFFNKKTGHIDAKSALSYEVETDDLSMTITGLPAGINVMCHGLFVTSDREPTVITFDAPGTYRVELSGAAPYLFESMEVTIGDP